jgi:hypothetical protein
VFRNIKGPLAVIAPLLHRVIAGGSGLSRLCQEDPANAPLEMALAFPTPQGMAGLACPGEAAKRNCETPEDYPRRGGKTSWYFAD